MPQLILALIIALTGFGSAWKIQDWRYGAREAEHAQQILADQRLSAAVAIRRADNVIDAQNAATIRDRGLRDAAAGARAALVGLHDAAGRAMRDAEASHSTCVDAATAQRAVLTQCAESYQGMAEVADRHVSDIKTLIDASPKE